MTQYALSTFDIILSVIGTVATVFIAVAAFAQLSEIGRNQRRRDTLQACDRYDSDTVIVDAHRCLSKFYEEKEVDNDGVMNSFSTLMNYFDSIAIGIEQGLYIKEIVEAHLSNIMCSVVDEFMSSKEPLIFASKSELFDGYESFQMLDKQFEKNKK